LHSPAVTELKMSPQDHQAQIVAFISEKGLTRCPTACVAPTRASGTAAERAALCERFDRVEAIREMAREARRRAIRAA